MELIKGRSLVNLLIFVVLLVGALESAVWDRLQAVSTDTLLALRFHVYGDRYSAEDSKVVVLAFDEATYRTPPFKVVPHELWTPEVAAVSDAVMSAGATVLGFDAIFSTSPAQFIAGFDRPLLKTLMQYGRQDRLVLGMVQHSEEPILPHISQRMVVGGTKNVKPLNVVSDVDDVIRRVPLYFTLEDGTSTPSMVLELASRALGNQPVLMENGDVILNDYTLVNAQHDHLLVNFQGGSDIPTFNFADLYHCTQSEMATAYFTQYFKDKVVLLGSVLDLEDRKTTSSRFMTDGMPGQYAPACTDKVSRSHLSSYRRDTIPGVYIHAAAINNLLRQDALHGMDMQKALALVVVMALLTMLITANTRALTGALLSFFLALIVVAVSVESIRQTLVLPMMQMLAAMVLSYGLTLLYRYAVVDKQKHKIRDLFSLYLEPSLVDAMVNSDRLPELGGETREVTVWFSDLANFTNISEALTAQELVVLMNDYFSKVTDMIEAHGGFVDKYIGDAVVAVFGAPHQDSQHAINAVTCALKVQQMLAEENAKQTFGTHPVMTRIGINTGDVVVGNVGSSRRFNYTVMGDTVNLASRLEGANKVVGSMILLSQQTAHALQAHFVLAYLGKLRVKGKLEPTKVFTPIDFAATAKSDHVAFAAAMEEAQHWVERGEFERVASCVAVWKSLPEVASLLHRVEFLMENPPPQDWDGVAILESK